MASKTRSPQRFLRFMLMAIFLPFTNSFAEEVNLTLSPLAITGRIFSDLYFPLRDLGQSKFQQISSSFWLQANPKFSESGSAHFTFTAMDLEASAISNNEGFTPSLREGYLDYSKAGWNIRTGKMIVPWGKSDGINPTDLLTAKNFTIFNPDEEVRRTGAVSILVSWTPSQGDSPWTLSGIVTPVFPKSKLLLQSSAFPSQINLSSSVSNPAANLSNSESAFKLSYAGQQWDFSWSAFSGWNHLPEFEVVSIQTLGASSNPEVSATIEQTFHRYRALGLDTSFTSGKWIFRGESAYVWTENDDGTTPMIQPSHWDFVLGTERSFWEDFRIQAQSVFRFFPRYQAPTQAAGSNALQTGVFQQVAALNALIQGYQDSFRPAATLRLSYSNEFKGLAADAFIYMNFVGGDYLFRPSLDYFLTESFKLTVGVDYYGGPSNRPLGRLSEFNSLFLEAKYFF
jgi:hypothetical protein